MLDCSVALAIPKSASLTTPSSETQQVAGLDVAVHDAVAVGVVEAAAGLADDVDASSTSIGPSVAQDLGARAAADVLHDDEVAGAGLVEAEVEDLDDVGVHEPRGRQRLAAEARRRTSVVGEVLGQQLDRDLALEALVEGEVHGRHAADAEAALEPVAPGDAGSVMALTVPVAALALAVAGAAAVAAAVGSRCRCRRSCRSAASRVGWVSVVWVGRRWASCSRRRRRRSSWCRSLVVVVALGRRPSSRAAGSSRALGRGLAAQRVRGPARGRALQRGSTLGRQRVDVRLGALDGGARRGRTGRRRTRAAGVEFALIASASLPGISS